MMRRYVFLINAGIILSCLSGCTNKQSMLAPNLEYSWGVCNPTNITFVDSAIQYRLGDGTIFNDEFGIVPVGSSKRISFGPNPIPTAVTVSWQTPDGTTRRQELVVAAIVPNAPTFRGTIWFRLTEKTVTAVPMTKEEQRARAMRQEPDWSK